MKGHDEGCLYSCTFTFAMRTASKSQAFWQKHVVCAMQQWGEG